jgi:hypothetical protein
MNALVTTALAAVFCACGLAAARADEAPTYLGPLSPAEEQFVSSVKADLLARYPHATDAEKAGYVRYTSPDDTGAISYANPKFWSSDPTHPSQLWYDASGNLMGADFSVPRPNGNPRPQVWGINPGRWYEFNGHVHYVVREPDGKMLYDQWIWNGDFVKAGGDPTNPSPDILVKAGRVPSPSSIQTIFEFPTIWDLIVWIQPHAAGAFHW